MLSTQQSNQCRTSEERGASHREIAEYLRSEYPSVFPTKVSAKQVVDAIVNAMKEVLLRDGRLCLRGIGAITVVEPTQALKEDGRPYMRRRLTASTSWVMLDRLNPENPKNPEKRKRA